MTNNCCVTHLLSLFPVCLLMLFFPSATNAQTILQGSFENPVGPINMNAHIVTPTSFNSTYLSGQQYSTFGGNDALVYISRCQAVNYFYSANNTIIAGEGIEPSGATQGLQAFGFTYGVTTALQLSGNLVPNQCYTIQFDIYNSHFAEGSIISEETNLQFGASSSNNSFGSTIYTTPTPITSLANPDNTANWQHVSFTFSVTASNLNYITFRIPLSDPANLFLMIDNIVLSNCLVTPVKWLSFNAEKENDIVKLNWSTATESNNKGFVIEHSIDGIQWNTVGVEQSKNGNSTSIQQYIFLHNDPSQGINYYRLVQVDLDEKKDYSFIRTVKFSTAIKSYAISPNPAAGFLYLLNGNSNTIKEIILADNLGRILYKGKYLQSGIDISKFLSGIYFLQIVKTNGTIQTEKLVKR